ncbi:MAG: MmcQ/YjbR family DNA-binding protein [Bacilli bacterium]|nr:MmcQ/YjbR family DNA-binding protein [Bacilli bacterium]
MDEEELFKRCVADYKKLIEYGFKKESDNSYRYNAKLVDDLEINVVVSDKVECRIVDTAFNAEYVNHKIDSQTGSFVGLVREKYIDLLNDIKDKCFINKPFITDQANRISSLIERKYNILPSFKWKEYDYGVFCNNNKWFGLIANVDRNKIDGKNGMVDIINLKVKCASELLNRKGFYKAYHMNKKNWITIILDESLKDEEIMELVDESYGYTVTFKGSSNEWVMPINPHYFDVFTYFDSTDLFYWDKKKGFKKDDIIYLYITKPIGSIMYKFMVDDLTDDFMIVRKLSKYDKNKYKLELLKKYGLTSVRSARHIPFKLSDYLKNE